MRLADHPVAFTVAFLIDALFVLSLIIWPAWRNEIKHMPGRWLPSWVEPQPIPAATQTPASSSNDRPATSEPPVVPPPAMPPSTPPSQDTPPTSRVGRGRQTTSSSHAVGLTAPSLPPPPPYSRSDPSDIRNWVLQQLGEVLDDFRHLLAWTQSNAQESCRAASVVIQLDMLKAQERVDQLEKRIEEYERKVARSFAAIRVACTAKQYGDVSSHGTPGVSGRISLSQRIVVPFATNRDTRGGIV